MRRHAFGRLEWKRSNYSNDWPGSRCTTDQSLGPGTGMGWKLSSGVKARCSTDERSLVGPIAQAAPSILAAERP
jgi:hypothetical protein